MHFDFLALVVGNMPSDRNTPFYGELGAELTRRGYSYGCITTSRFADRSIADYGHTCFNLHDMINELRSRRDICHAEEANRIEQKYDINIKNYCLAEAMLVKPHSKDDKQLYEDVIESFILVEDFLKNHDIGSFIWDQGGEIIRRTLSQVGRFMNVPSIWINWSPIRGCMTLRSSELDIRDDLVQIADYADLTPVEIDRAETYIASFKNRQEMYLHPNQLGFWINPLKVLKPLKELYRKYKLNKGQESRKVVKLYALILLKHCKKLLYDISLSRDPDRNEKFFFFPLHFPRESQLTVRAPHCLKQEAIVDMVARSLPSGYKLYVKEHPNHIGEVPLGAIRQISKMKDVVLLHPQTHSHRLIQDSSGVVVINSTVGFESILYQKPVIVLGRPFYSRLGLTIDVPDYFYLPDALREALRQEEIPYEKVVAFVHSMLEESYAGGYGDFSRQNIKLVADSVLTYREKILQKEKMYHEHLLNL
jgi:hypothetical protein